MKTKPHTYRTRDRGVCVCVYSGMSRAMMSGRMQDRTGDEGSSSSSRLRGRFASSPSGDRRRSGKRASKADGAKQEDDDDNHQGSDEEDGDSSTEREQMKKEKRKKREKRRRGEDRDSPAGFSAGARLGRAGKQYASVLRTYRYCECCIYAVSVCSICK